MSGALSDIRILDLTHMLAGPYCTMMLGDMGARVIKIEIPGRGDDTRAFAPFKNGRSLFFASVNRSKRGISLNLKAPEGKELFLKMVRNADIVVENYRPGVMDKLGVGYDVLRQVNPRIIYGAVSGFGCYGRYSERPGLDIIAQAMGGLMSVTGERGGRPTCCGSVIGDILGGMNLAAGLLAALNARRLTGVGQRVDISLVDSITASLESLPQFYFESGVLPDRIGNESRTEYPSGSFRAKDRDFAVEAGGDEAFAALSAAMGRPELAHDMRFSTLNERNKRENRDALAAIINSWAEGFTASEITERLLEAGIPAAPVMDLKDVTGDAHIACDREMFVDLDHPVIGPMRVLGNPVKLMGTPVSISRPAPAVPGADNEAVYQGIFGLAPDEVRELKDKGVL